MVCPCVSLLYCKISTLLSHLKWRLEGSWIILYLEVQSSVVAIFQIQHNSIQQTAFSTMMNLRKGEAEFQDAVKLLKQKRARGGHEKTKAALCMSCYDKTLLRVFHMKNLYPLRPSSEK